MHDEVKMFALVVLDNKLTRGKYTYKRCRILTGGKMAFFSQQTF